MNAFIVLSVLFAAAAAEKCNLVCQYNYDPVCGSDARTYSNECELQSRACMTRMSTKVAHTGECEKTVMNSACNELCTFDYSPVCGSDGQTYDNECALNSIACMKKAEVAVSHSGECRSKADKVKLITGCEIACQANYDPICGSDGNTYGNMCELQTLSCLKKSSVKAAHKGECSQKAVRCNELCTLDYVPICGSDSHTYSNECELESLACLRKSGVKMAHKGEC